MAQVDYDLIVIGAGERYVGGGNSLANAITMGRVAGMTIGQELKG